MNDNGEFYTVKEVAATFQLTPNTGQRIWLQWPIRVPRSLQLR
ncbi:hypothetical protein J2809_000443 [Arthrobacter pascens]|nr:hypothetical protein [Arthrobacter pascens]MDR6556112.1 hypothetical protein [Arthrobacter pascens]